MLTGGRKTAIMELIRKKKQLISWKSNCFACGWACNLYFSLIMTELVAHFSSGFVCVIVFKCLIKLVILIENPGH